MEYCKEFQEELIKLYESLVKKGMHPSSPFYVRLKKYIKLGVKIEDVYSFIYDLGVQNPEFTFEECFMDQCLDNNKIILWNSHYAEYVERKKKEKRK